MFCQKGKIFPDFFWNPSLISFDFDSEQGHFGCSASFFEENKVRGWQCDIKDNCHPLLVKSNKLDEFIRQQIM